MKDMIYKLPTDSRGDLLFHQQRNLGTISTVMGLINIKQKEGESLQSYFTRFKDEM